MVGSNGILDTGQVEVEKRQINRWKKDEKRQINRWKKIVSRFRGKLVKMIRDAGSKFDDYSTSPKKR